MQFMLLIKILSIIQISVFLFQTACRLQYNELLEKKCRKLQNDYSRIVNILNEMFDYVEQINHEVGVRN